MRGDRDMCHSKEHSGRCCRGHASAWAATSHAGGFGPAEVVASEVGGLADQGLTADRFAVCGQIGRL